MSYAIRKTSNHVIRETAEENVALNAELETLRNLAELDEQQTQQLRLDLAQAQARFKINGSSFSFDLKNDSERSYKMTHMI